MTNLIFFITSPLKGPIQLLGDYNPSVLDKINIYIYPIIIFLINLYNKIKKTKLDVIAKYNYIMPQIKSFMKHLWPLIIAFIKYHVKKCYYILMKKKFLMLYIYKEAWNLCIQLHKINYSYAESRFISKVTNIFIIPYLVCIFSIVFNYFVWKLMYIYNPSYNPERDGTFDELYLKMCKDTELDLAGL